MDTIILRTVRDELNRYFITGVEFHFNSDIYVINLNKRGYSDYLIALI